METRNFSLQLTHLNAGSIIGTDLTLFDAPAGKTYDVVLLVSLENAVGPCSYAYVRAELVLEAVDPSAIVDSSPYWGESPAEALCPELPMPSAPFPNYGAAPVDSTMHTGGRGCSVKLRVSINSGVLDATEYRFSVQANFTEQ